MPIKNKSKMRIIAFLLLLLPICFSLISKSPEGTSIKSEFYDVSDIEFFYDLTYKKNGSTIHEQNILKQELKTIQEAQEYIIADFFLFNDGYDKEKDKYPNSVEQITNALIEKKKSIPEIEIVFITDPINSFYGAYKEKFQKSMEDNGITVIQTDLDKLKDSNPIYSGYYDILVKPFGVAGNGWIQNPFDPQSPKVNLRTMLKLANLKANHRKIIITDKEAFITSSNPHDASSYHSNVGARVKGNVVNEMIKGEKTVAKFSGVELPDFKYNSDNDIIFDTQVRYITEKSIFDSLIENIKLSKEGDAINIGIFYISDFDIVKELEKAANRGVNVKIIADPNKDAFGIKKDGSPNRTVLTNLVNKSENIHVRWYDTNGEQYHSKIAYFSFEDKEVTILGSGNYTRRNIKGYNLECNIEVVTGKDSEFSKDVLDYFNRIWNNEGGEYTVDFSVYKQDSIIKRCFYVIQEFTGLCSY